MNYPLLHKNDNKRLIDQAKIECYSPQSDFKHFTIKENSYVLDAGCGPGVMSRYLYDHYTHNIDAVDFDQEKIKQAKEKSSLYKINYFQGDITNLPIRDNLYDVIISRYVIEHLKNPLTALRELKRVLKPGGKLVIIESDGVLFNISTENNFLNDCLQTLKEKFTFDLYVGKKVSSFMDHINMNNINESTSPMNFVGEDLTREIKNYIDRFEIGMPLLQNILGNINARKFVDTYLKELSIPSTKLNYTKIIVEGIK